MFCAAIQEFAFSLPTDAGLLRAGVSAGEPIDQTEVLSLAAMAQSLFVTATIESRRLDRVEDCRRLWGETARVFEELCSAWAGVQSDDSSVAWLRGRLEHYRSLCVDRVELFSITESARREFAERRAADSDNEHAFGTRGDIEPVREFSKLETASIERAYRRHQGVSI
jgi:hypothetical protein